MPKLSVETKDLEIKQIEGGVVTVISKPNFGVVAGMRQEMSPMEVAEMMLPRLIVDWNFEDDQGKKLDINIENIKKLPAESVVEIVNEVMKDIGPSLKKKTSGESARTSKESG